MNFGVAWNEYMRENVFDTNGALRLSSGLTHRVLFIAVLPLLVEFPHVHQAVLHLFQSPDLLPFAFPADLDGRLAQHYISLHIESKLLLGSIFLLSFIRLKKKKQHKKNKAIIPSC